MLCVSGHPCPAAPLVYLEQWMESREQLEKAAAAGEASTKPANGWKLDKNIQNWRGGA